MSRLGEGLRLARGGAHCRPRARRGQDNESTQQVRRLRLGIRYNHMTFPKEIGWQALQWTNLNRRLLRSLGLGLQTFQSVQQLRSHLYVLNYQPRILAVNDGQSAAKQISIELFCGRLAGPHEPGERLRPPGGLLFKAAV